MKRLFFVASLAILAAACQKTEIQNEVQTPISFSTETGKQTRAIMADNYDQTQPFGVYAWGYDNGNLDANAVMDNVEIAKNTTDSKWEATSGKYYWPNNANSTMSFFAYSPFIGTNQAPVKNHQTMTATSVSHNTTDGLSIQNYTHNNMYVDFMVATPVIGATYAHQDGYVNENSDKVPAVFHHEMTQIMFEVGTNQDYGTGITFTVDKIELTGIGNTASYTNASLNSTFTEGSWTAPTAYSGEYTIFPQKVYSETETNGCPALEADQTARTVTSTDFLTTTGVTMIPQSMVANKQKFTITYRIAGNAVADETVTKEVYFASINNAKPWENNQKLTYKVKIGLHQIYFEPTIAQDWGPADGDTYYIPESTTPTTSVDPTVE